MALIKDDFPIFGVPKTMILIPCKYKDHMISHDPYMLTFLGTTPPAKSTIHGNICGVYIITFLGTIFTLN